MKKAFLVLLVLLMTLCLAACGSTPAPVDNPTDVPSDSDVTASPEATAEPSPVPSEPESIFLDSSWKYAESSAIHTGAAVLYRAQANRKNIVIGVNAGHGTEGGTSVKTNCHPDGSPKTTGGSTGKGATQATAVAGGMTFNNGASEASVTLGVAQKLKAILLENGYDVLMVRDGDDVQLDNVARTVICNNAADCHISIHFDGEDCSYDKGCFYISTPDGIKNMEPVASTWQKSEELGKCLTGGLTGNGVKLFGDGTMAIDLTQTSYSSVPSVDIELGNQCSDTSDASLQKYAEGLYAGINSYFSN